MTAPLIHPTALIDPQAQLHPSVAVGPYTVIGPQVEIGEDTRVGPHVVLKGPMRIGRRNQIFQFASLGEISQDKTARPEHDTRVEIGDDNTIREYVTIQRGTLKQDRVTRIGNDNWIMAYVHIAHDCSVDDHTVLANMTTLAGHVHLEDYVVLGGATLIHQYCRIGQHAFSAGGAGITRDVPPFVVVQGNPAVPRGINIEGIRRRDFSAEDIADIKRAYRALFVAGLDPQALRADLTEAAARCVHVRTWLAFVESSKRLVQKAKSDE